MVRRHLIRLFILFTTIVGGLAVAGPAHAAALAVNSLPTVIGNITAWFVGLALGLGTLFATYSFVLYQSAGGDTGTIEKAKTAFKGALLGYAGALLAPVLFGIVRGWIGG